MDAVTSDIILLGVSDWSVTRAVLPGEVSGSLTGLTYTFELHQRVDVADGSLHILLHIVNINSFASIGASDRPKPIRHEQQVAFSARLIDLSAFVTIRAVDMASQYHLGAKQALNGFLVKLQCAKSACIRGEFSNSPSSSAKLMEIVVRDAGAAERIKEALERAIKLQGA